MVKLAIRYITYFKKQSFYVLFSIAISAMILTAINTVLATDRKISLEEARGFYGDFHYVYPVSEKDIPKVRDIMAECHIEGMSFCRIGDYLDMPSVAMELVQADGNWMEMTGSGILEGRYPERKGEIALEEWVTGYFGKKGIGDEIKMTDDKENVTRSFILTGILKDRKYAKGVGAKAGFVSNYDVGNDEALSLYIKFDEKTDLREDNRAFSKIIGSKAKSYNWNVIEKVDFKYSNITYADALKGGGDGFLFVEWVAGSGIAQRLANISVALFITKAVKYRRFYLHKFLSATLSSFAVALATAQSSALQNKNLFCVKFIDI